MYGCVEMQKYNTKYDGINVDEIISNRRVLEAYSKCLLDQGKCTNEGTELKSEQTKCNFLSICVYNMYFYCP